MYADDAGRAIHERLAVAAQAALRPGGHLVVEVAEGQAPWLGGASRGSRLRRRRGDPATCAASSAWSKTRAGYPDRVPLRLDLAEPRVDLAPLTAALAEGACAVIPTDTVYGLVCAAGQVEACARLSALKGRDPRQPSTVMFATLAGRRDAARAA